LRYQKEPGIEITLLADKLEFRYIRVQDELAAKDIKIPEGSVSTLV
jgi:hypothetical protein